MVKKTSWGGETGFLDRILAYDLLPARLKAAIEGLSVIYRLSVYHHETRYGTKSKVRTLQTSEFQRKVSERMDRDFPPVSHPLVYTQEETGRKVLNLSPYFALHIDGHDDHAGHSLLQELVDHLAGCPAYFHDWQPNDLVLWDNWRMVHSVNGAPADEIRIVQRTTIAGDYGLGRAVAA
jgi:taurine dioxygenase